MKSMTGYVKLSKSIKGYGSVTCEIRSVNGKGLNTTFKLPYELSTLENDLRKIISKKIKKGNISVNFFVNYSSDYIQNFVETRIKSLEKVMGMEKYEKFLPLVYSDVSNYIPLVKKVERDTLLSIVKLFKLSLSSFIKYREEEGMEIKKIIHQYIKILNSNINSIKNLSKNIVKEKKEKLKKLLGEYNEQLKNELILYADKVDITEEIDRFKIHLRRLKKEESGSSITFVLQELQREANTISSKSEDVRIIEKVIRIKEIIEKMKEQVANVE
ncbi:MAG: DUF1732 domain-containing protein [candidate division WOR-3 bacterium]